MNDESYRAYRDKLVMLSDQQLMMLALSVAVRPSYVYVSEEMKAAISAELIKRSGVNDISG